MDPMPWRSVCQVRCVEISGGWKSRWVAVRQRDSSHQGLARSARAWIAGAALPSGDAPPECGGRHLGNHEGTFGDGEGPTVSSLTKTEKAAVQDVDLRGADARGKGMKALLHKHLGP